VETYGYYFGVNTSLPACDGNAAHASRCRIAERDNNRDFSFSFCHLDKHLYVALRGCQHSKIVGPFLTPLAATQYE